MTNEESKKELKDTINKTFNKVDMNNETVKTAITSYNTVNKYVTLQNGVLLVIILILILGLLTWSLYKWMKPLGKVFITSSILVFIICGLSYYLVSVIKEKTNFDITLDNKMMITLGIIELAIGIVLIILYKVCGKIKLPKKPYVPERAEIPTDNIIIEHKGEEENKPNPMDVFDMKPEAEGEVLPTDVEAPPMITPLDDSEDQNKLG